MAKKKPEVALNAAPAPKDNMHDYEVDDAMRTLLRAEEIKANDKLMDAVQKKLTGQSKAIKSIADLRKKKAELDAEEEAEEADEV